MERGAMQAVMLAVKWTAMRLGSISQWIRMHANPETLVTHP